MRYLLVDAHSVIFSWPELHDLHARNGLAARVELTRRLTAYQDATGVRVVVVFDGKGQNKEGNGHDVFVGVPYERMNKIRLVSVKMDDKSASIIADLAPAYEPELGVKKFTRSFVFLAPGSFTVTDSIETDKPQTITSYLHSDHKINKVSDRSFIFEPGRTHLKVDVIKPEGLDTKSEINILTAPGKPGSVDKGEREERGVRLAVSTKQKVNKLDLVVKMTVEKPK